MNDWRIAEVAEVAAVFNGKTPSKAEQRSKGHPVLKIRDVSEIGEYRGVFESFVDPKFASKFANKHVQEGDSLILNAAHNAAYVASKTFRAQPPTFGALPTGEWLVIRPDAKVLDGGFAHHWVNSVRTRRELRELVNGIHLYPKDVARLRIPVPPLPQQRRIAEVLDQAEALRVKRRAALAQLDTLSQSVFRQMFGSPSTILDAWQATKLGELLDFLTSGSRGWAEHYAETGDLFLRIQNVRRDQLLLEDIAFVNAPDTAEAKRTRVQPGDVLLSITADLGRTAVVPDRFGPAYINQHLCILRTCMLAPRFLCAYLASPIGQRQVKGRNRQGVKAGLNFDDIRSIVVPVPPLSMQMDFAQRVGSIEKLKATHRASLAELDALFAALQHRAFRGEL